MGRHVARFRISIKDQQTSKMIKVELIESPGLLGREALSPGPESFEIRRDSNTKANDHSRDSS
jgi:hypothetical protein